MLPLETKESGGKLLTHSDLRGGVVLGEAFRKIHREMKLGTWNVRSFYRAGSLKAAARELARYNIRMDLQEVGCGYVDWIGLAQDRDRWRTLVSTVMNVRVPWNAGNFLTSCKPVSFSRRTLHRGVSKTTRFMITVRHVNGWTGGTKYQAAWFLLNRVYKLEWKSKTVILSSYNNMTYGHKCN